MGWKRGPRTQYFIRGVCQGLRVPNLRSTLVMREPGKAVRATALKRKEGADDSKLNKERSGDLIDEEKGKERTPGRKEKGRTRSRREGKERPRAKMTLQKGQAAGTCSCPRYSAASAPTAVCPVRELGNLYLLTCASGNSLPGVSLCCSFRVGKAHSTGISQVFLPLLRSCPPASRHISPAFLASTQFCIAFDTPSV